VLFHADVFEYTDTFGDSRSYHNIVGIFATYRVHYYMSWPSYPGYGGSEVYGRFFDVATDADVSVDGKQVDWVRTLSEADMAPVVTAGFPTGTPEEPVVPSVSVGRVIIAD